MDNTKIGNSYRENKEISRTKTHINSQKLNWYVFTQSIYEYIINSLLIEKDIYGCWNVSVNVVVLSILILHYNMYYFALKYVLFSLHFARTLLNSSKFNKVLAKWSENNTYYSAK